MDGCTVLDLFGCQGRPPAHLALDPELLILFREGDATLALMQALCHLVQGVAQTAGNAHASDLE